MKKWIVIAIMVMTSTMAFAGNTKIGSIKQNDIRNLVKTVARLKHPDIYKRQAYLSDWARHNRNCGYGNNIPSSFSKRTRAEIARFQAECTEKRAEYSSMRERIMSVEQAEFRNILHNHFQDYILIYDSDRASKYIYTSAEVTDLTLRVEHILQNEISQLSANN